MWCIPIQALLNYMRLDDFSFEFKIHHALNDKLLTTAHTTETCLFYHKMSALPFNWAIQYNYLVWHIIKVTYRIAKCTIRASCKHWLSMKSTYHLDYSQIYEWKASF